MPPLNVFHRTVLALAMAQLTTQAVPAMAADILVTTEDDSGCSLGEAIQSANNNSSVGGCSTGVADDTIRFDSALYGTGSVINIGANLPAITDVLTITGPGQSLLTIDGKGYGPLFDVDGTTAVLEHFAITNASSGADGGAVLGRDDSYSDVTVSHMTITDSRATDRGGAVAILTGAARIEHSTISGNTTYSRGGGIAFDEAIVTIHSASISGNTVMSTDTYALTGGGISIGDSTVTLTDSKIFDNVVNSESRNAYGGGFDVYDSAHVTIVDSTIQGNSAAKILPSRNAAGGGIFAGGSSTLVISGSSITDSFASNRGGGLYTTGDSTVVSIQNSTISGNNALGDGAGMRITGYSYVTLGNVTVTGNSAGGDGGGILVSSEGSLGLINTIVSGNMSDGNGNELSLKIDNPDTAFLASNNANLLGSAESISDDAFYNLPATGDIIASSDSSNSQSVGAILNPLLANNGGPTKTHALVSGSQAIGAADLTACPQKDQRGRERGGSDFFVNIVADNGNIAVVDLGDDYCDIGAVEYP